MATLYSAEMTGVDSIPASKPAAPNSYFARVKRFRATITLASQATTDTVVLADIPAGMVFAGGEITSSVSLGSSTIAVGTSASTAKYKAAATFTATDTPTPFGKASALAMDPLASPERIILTIAAAALPSSGTLVIDLYFTSAN